MYPFANKKSGECSGKNEEEKTSSNLDEHEYKKPDRYIDPTEYELNCMSNKFQRAQLYVNTLNKLKKAASMVSTAMDHDLKKPDLNEIHQNFKKTKDYIDVKNYCPNFHELQQHNNRFK